MRNTGLTGAAILSLALSAGAALADETRRVEGLEFHSVDVMGAVSVEVRQGDSTVLQLRGPADDLDRNPFYLKGKRLVIGSSLEDRRRDFYKVKFRIEVPALRQLSVKGSGEAYIKTLELGDDDLELSVDGSGDIKLFGVSGDALELSVKGSGDIKAVDIDVEQLRAVVAGSGDLFIQRLQADTVEFVVTGSGDIAVTDGGSVDSLEATIVGSGDIDARGVSAATAEVSIVGSGTADLGEVRDTIDATILGSGDVVYDGDPEVESVELGSGDCRRRD
jgi:hypothetical protein